MTAESPPDSSPDRRPVEEPVTVLEDRDDRPTLPRCGGPVDAVTARSPDDRCASRCGCRFGSLEPVR